MRHKRYKRTKCIPFMVSQETTREEVTKCLRRELKANRKYNEKRIKNECDTTANIEGAYKFLILW